MLFDVLTTFGELTPEVAHHQKYAKWKAAYIHNCLKSGETPVAGPLATGEDEEPCDDENSPAQAGGWSQPSEPPPPTHQPPPPSQPSYEPPPSQPAYQFPVNPQPIHQPPQASFQQPSVPQHAGGKVSLATEQTKKAQKYCKFAISSLDYEDTGTAIINLQKALHLCQTGQDSP
jgi:vacuolar protein sorting-associated protein VTA1